MGRCCYGVVEKPLPVISEIKVGEINIFPDNFDFTAQTPERMCYADVTRDQ